MIAIYVCSNLLGHEVDSVNSKNAIEGKEAFLWDTSVFLQKLPYSNNNKVNRKQAYKFYNNIYRKLLYSKNHYILS